METAETAKVAEKNDDGGPDAFAELPVPPELLEADVTETLDSVFSETLLEPGPDPALETVAVVLEPEEASGAVPQRLEAVPVVGPGPVPPAPTIHDAVTLVTGPISTGPIVPAPSSVAELFDTLPLRFRADRAAGWSARFHFRFKDVARSDWTVVVEDGACRTLEGHDGLADCVVTTTEKTYLAVECGQQSPETAFLLGKVKVSNIGAMTRFGRLFRKVTAT